MGTMKSGMIFVFGSNLAGRHGAGAALEAREKWGAEIGRGIGRMGSSYAIPTKDKNLQVLPISEIEIHIVEFLGYAFIHPELNFFITRVGCGLAGYSNSEIAPFFKGAPKNCQLPESWKEYT